MKEIRLHIAALSHSVTQSQNYAIILKEEEGVRRLPIIIGRFEAQSIAIALERLDPMRPITHDLFKSTMDIYKVHLEKVIINDLDEGIFYAQLICKQQDGESVEIDSRASDALAMAVRFDCPIYTYDFVMDTAGIVFENPDDEQSVVVEEGEASRSLSSFSEPELNEMLQDLLEKEEYERAADIRDELKRRKV